jgi:hypothetical protein
MSDFNDTFAESFDVAADGSPGMAETFTCEGQEFTAIENGITRSNDPNQRGGGRTIIVEGMIYVSWSQWTSAGLAQGKIIARADGAYTARIVSTPTRSNPTADVQISGTAVS